MNFYTSIRILMIVLKFKNDGILVKIPYYSEPQTIYLLNNLYVPYFQPKIIIMNINKWQFLILGHV